MGPGSNYDTGRRFASSAIVIRAWPHLIGRALAGEEPLWKVWWLGVIPVALAATALTLLAEFLRADGYHSWGNFFDVLKLLAYVMWFTAAWRSAANTVRVPARIAGRIAVAAGVFTAALTV
jgi:chromate transport protein ChrA